jgi:hypothetical protein
MASVTQLGAGSTGKADFAHGRTQVTGTAAKSPRVIGGPLSRPEKWQEPLERVLTVLVA